MDDISLIGSFALLELVAQEIANSYEISGFHLFASKCLLIGSSPQDIAVNNSVVPFTNHSSEAFEFLGCWLGNVPQIQNELQAILEKMKIELDSISSLDLEKHIEFFKVKIRLTGRITHILRSCAPSLAFCRSLISLRTEFFAELLDAEPGMSKNHLFSSANLSGIGLTKSSILCQSAFLGGGKNFIYEFSRRFSDDSHLLVSSCSPYLNKLSCEIDRLPPQIWTKCCPQSIQEIPNRFLFNLQFCCKKLQQKLSYNESLSKMFSQQHAKYNLYPFVFSLFGSLAPTAIRFWADFEMIEKLTEISTDCFGKIDLCFLFLKGC
ncbi:hypothetical protein P9112_000087 [Eukaryota sp. TZLM1-RC]